MALARQPKRPLSEPLFQELNSAHAGLIRVHKALLDYEKARYEKERRRISGPGEYLQLVINDPWFAWLRPVSELAALIDEIVSSREPADPKFGEALLKQARELIVPAEGGNDFQRAYFGALQNSSGVSAAHGEWKLAMRRDKGEA